MIGKNPLILVFGLLILLNFTSCSWGGNQPKKNTMTESKSPVPTQSNLPPLQLGSSEQVLNLMDSLYQEGGTQAVVKWAEQELQPGRQIRYKGRIGEKVETPVIYDRSIWRLDEQGKLSNEALLSPLTDEKFGESEVFALWSRPHAEEPFLLRLRTWINPS
jgi:hypothetical protein